MATENRGISYKVPTIGQGPSQMEAHLRLAEQRQRGELKRIVLVSFCFPILNDNGYPILNMKFWRFEKLFKELVKGLRSLITQPF